VRERTFAPENFIHADPSAELPLSQRRYAARFPEFFRSRKLKFLIFLFLENHSTHIAGGARRAQGISLSRACDNLIAHATAITAPTVHPRSSDAKNFPRAQGLVPLLRNMAPFLPYHR